MPESYIQLPTDGNGKKTRTFERTVGTSVVHEAYVIAVPYAVRLDETSTPNVTYVGETASGTSTSEAIWRIRKLDETSDLIITWADGDKLEDNIWDDRVSLTYL